MGLLNPIQHDPLMRGNSHKVRTLCGKSVRSLASCRFIVGKSFSTSFYTNAQRREEVSAFFHVILERPNFVISWGRTAYLQLASGLCINLRRESI